jgi:hypothetical protein
VIKKIRLSTFEEKNGNLPKVKVDEVLGFMRYITTKISAHNCVPRGVILFVELFLDVRSNIFLDVELLHRLCGAVNGVLLHILGHVCVLDHGFAVGHFLNVAGEHS